MKNCVMGAIKQTLFEDRITFFYPNGTTKRTSLKSLGELKDRLSELCIYRALFLYREKWQVLDLSYLDMKEEAARIYEDIFYLAVRQFIEEAKIVLELRDACVRGIELDVLKEIYEGIAFK